MALDKILKIYDENGSEVDYDILANDVKFQDGKDLPTVLDEMEQEIQDAGGYEPPAGGIPKTDLAQGVQDSLDAADSAYQKPASGIPATDMTQAVQDALVEAASAVQPGDSIPASDVTGLATVATSGDYDDLQNKPTIPTVPSDIVQSVSVNGGSPESPDQDGNVDLSVPPGQNGITPHIGANGNWWTGPETDPANDTGDPARGPQGAQGNVQVDGDGNVLIVNNLTEGGSGAALSAEMGLLIKHQVDSLYTSLNRLYSKLANIAFWDAQDQEDAAPTPLNWNVPLSTLTFDLTGVGAGVSVKLNGETVTGNRSVEKGSTNTLTIEAIEDWLLNNDIAVEVDGVPQTLTESGGVYSLDLTVNANITVEVVGTATQEWFTAPKNDEMNGNTVVRYGMQQGRSFNGTNGSMVNGAAQDIGKTVVASPAGYKESVKIYNYGDLVDGYNNSNPGKTTANYFATGNKRYVTVKIIDTQLATGDFYRVAVGCFSSAVIGNSQANVFSSGIEVTGNKGRSDYAATTLMPDGSMQIKIDLSAQAADIQYVKLFINKRNSGNTSLDTSGYYDNMTVKYKFSDD